MALIKMCVVPKLQPTTVLAYPVDYDCSCHLLDTHYCYLCLNGSLNPTSASHPPTHSHHPPTHPPTPSTHPHHPPIHPPPPSKTTIHPPTPLLNQARAGCRLAYIWFLRIASVCERRYACVCVSAPEAINN